jgi:diguanylate cyclase (GGDEF)-like protein
MKRLERIGRGNTAIVFIDLDRFKAINDEQGHQAGDYALKSVAKAIKNNIRAGMDYPCRYGGDEFAVILTEIEPKGLHRFAERLKNGINTCWKEHIAVSIGVALCKENEDAASLLRRADKASYTAKSSGGDKVVFAD